LYTYLTDGIGVLGFQTNGLFNTSVTPKLGNTPVAAYDKSVILFASPSNLPYGLFDVGRVLPSGLSTTEVNFAYEPTGGTTVEPGLESAPATPAASGAYDKQTGYLHVDVYSDCRAVLFETRGLFNAGAAPLLGSLAPSQFDASNLMFFNNDAPLPTGTFNLGAVLPPGLNASQISLATKGTGIAVGIPVTVIPEPAALSLAGVALAVSSTRPPRAKRRRFRGVGQGQWRADDQRQLCAAHRKRRHEIRSQAVGERRAASGPQYNAL
jgi:hypothetical protein